MARGLFVAKISFIMITARDDYPYQHKDVAVARQIERGVGEKEVVTVGRDAKFVSRKDLHVFSPTLETLKQQTMKNFEWIIVDALYDQRKKFFKNMKLPFQVKHVPAKPNLWHEKNLPGICTQYNKGIIYADGELLFFTGDSYMFVPDFMKRLWNYFLKGYFPCAWYMRDYGRKNTFDSTLKKHNDIRKAPYAYDLLGYTGELVAIEHRYFHAFERDVALDKIGQKFAMPWEWWFANSTSSLKAMLDINGFDQKFDGDRLLSDCDVGSRLEMAGYGLYLTMFRDLFAVRVPSDVNVYASSIKKAKVSIKCNYGLLGFNRSHKQIRGNMKALTDEDINWIKNIWCTQRCALQQQCEKEHPWQYPFEHKNVPSHPPTSKSSKKWFNFWKTHQGLINLEEERELRLNNDKKYQEGTFLEAHAHT